MPVSPFRNPLTWLLRFRHRRGYGVHSPFAYEFITQVIYSPGRYYAFEWLDLQYRYWERLLHVRRMAVDHLLFRLANWRQPRLTCAPEAGKRELSYLHQGCLHAELAAEGRRAQSDLLYVSTLRGDETDLLCADGLLVVDRLRENKAQWQRLKEEERVRVTFDLHDVGIALLDGGLQRQDYVINW